MTNEEMIMNTNTETGTFTITKDPTVANDTDTIQEAINNYSHIILKKGTYRVSSLQLRSNIRIEGHNATLKIIDNEDQALRNKSTTNTCVFIAKELEENGEFVPVHDVEISGIRFDGNASYYMGLNNGTEVLDITAKFTSAGVVLQGAENIYIHHCTFEDFKSSGIHAMTPTADNSVGWCVRGLTVTDCEFNKNGVPTSYVKVNETVDAEGNTIREQVPVAGPTADNSAFPVAAPCRGITILSSGNQTSNRDILIERCIVHNAGEHGIVFYPLTENVTVRDCLVKNCGLYTGEEGVDKGAPGDYFTKYYARPENNKLTHTAGCNIKLNTVRNCLVENCYLYGTTSWGVSVYHDKEYPEPCFITIRNNIIEGNPNQARTGSGVVCECGHDITVIGNTIRNHLLDDHTEHAAYPEGGTNGDPERFYHSHAITLAKGHALNNVIEDCDHGISISNGTVVGNRILCGGTGITVDQKVKNNGTETEVKGDGSYCVVSENIVRGVVDVTALASKTCGIRMGFNSTSDRPCRGNAVYDNVFERFITGAEFYTDKHMENTTFSNNSFIGVTTESNFGNSYHKGTIADFTFTVGKVEA